MSQNFLPTLVTRRPLPPPFTCDVIHGCPLIKYAAYYQVHGLLGDNLYFFLVFD
jgi:hypothetical protein